MSDSDPLLRFRPYLISNSLGAMPRSASEALAEYADTWATRGVRALPRIVWEAGIEAIRAKSVRQTDRLLDLAHERGLSSAAPTDTALRGGAVAVDFEHALEVSRELNARDVIVDYRPGAGIRLAPHFYTADEELDKAFAAIDEIRESGAWHQWRERETIVT